MQNDRKPRPPKMAAGRVNLAIKPPAPETDNTPAEHTIPKGLTIAHVHSIAAILQHRPNIPTNQLAQALQLPAPQVEEARQQLQTRGVAWIDETDPHGLAWASNVPGPTEGDIGRARLRMMLAAVQKGALVAVSGLIHRYLQDPTAESLKPGDLARLLSTVSDQLRLERGEPTSIGGEALAAQQHREAQEALIARLLAEREAVASGKRVPGVS